MSATELMQTKVIYNAVALFLYRHKKAPWYQQGAFNVLIIARYKSKDFVQDTLTRGSLPFRSLSSTAKVKSPLPRFN